MSPRPLDASRQGMGRTLAGALGGTAVGIAVLWILISKALRGRWPWSDDLSNGSVVGVDVAVLCVFVAAVLVVGLAVLARRHGLTETDSFDAGFVNASRHLGAPSAAERLAGVYAMASLADDHPRRRQQCIDVLCSYLRLPYDPSAGLLSSLTTSQNWRFNAGGRRETRTYEALPNDREVRRSIIRVLRDRLLPNAAVSWQGHEFNLTGAVFDGGDFSGVELGSGRLLMAGATFASGWFSFDGAEFSGATVSLDGAIFAGGEVTFDEALFRAGDVSLVDAEVAGGAVSFVRAQFTGAQVILAHVGLVSGRMSFSSATFRDGRVLFDGARVTGGELLFDGATFSGSRVNLDRVAMTSGLVSFRDCTFQAGRARLSAIRLSGDAVVSFDDATFSDRAAVVVEDVVAGDGQLTRDGEEFYGYPEPAEQRQLLN